MIRVDDKRAAVRAACITAISGLGAFVLLDCPVRAQEAAAAGGEALQEVTVTANRRTENLQQVPIAVSVITGEMAGSMGVVDTMSLANAVPGLEFNRQSNASIPFLRGIGTPVGQAGDEPSVALYVDDVYIPAPQASLFNFNTIDRLEVEKGPQGTLFGRNATGGVVQVFTKNPTSTPSLDVEAGYANYDTYYYNGYATGGLTDTLSANIAGYASNQHNGWGTNLFSGNPAYTGWDNGGRAKLLWAPNDKFSALLTYDIDVTRTEVGVAYRPWPGTLAVPGVFPAPEGFYNLDERDSRAINHQQGASLKLNANFDSFQLVNIASWRQMETSQNFSYNSIPDIAPNLPLAYVSISTPVTTWTEELRLLSPASSRIRWIGGVFFMHDQAAYDPLNFQGAITMGLPYINTYGFQTTKSWSGFADGTLPITDKFNFTGGFRYTSDHREATAGTGTIPIPGLNPTGFLPASNSPQSHTWNEPTYRAVFNYQFTPDLMGYVGYNRGFKSGFYNLVVLPFSPIGPPVQPELLDAYTLGEKGEFFDHRLRVNTEFFYYKDKDIQVDEVNGAATFITNAASATFKGVDLDVTWLPVDRLTITAAIEVLDGKYDSFPNGQYWVYQPVAGGNCAFTVVPGGPLPCGGLSTPPNYNPTTGNWNLGGNKTIQSPPFSSYLSASYRVPSTMGPFDLNLAWTRTGSYYADADNGRGQVAPSTHFNNKQLILDLINASVNWTSPSGRWHAQLWGRNLANQKYWSFALQDAFETQYSANAPLTYGVTVGMHF
jgi:iron complex outermembrane receptor protein